MVTTLGHAAHNRETLARRLGLDIRGFYRDLDLLRKAGVSVTLTEGRYSLAANLAALVGREALGAAPARWGARLSLVGYGSTVGFWLVSAVGCGIEYVNTTCDAIVTPLMYASPIVGLASLPIGRVASVAVRRRR